MEAVLKARVRSKDPAERDERYISIRGKMHHFESSTMPHPARLENAAIGPEMGLKNRFQERIEDYDDHC